MAQVSGRWNGWASGGAEVSDVLEQGDERFGSESEDGIRSRLSIMAETLRLSQVPTGVAVVIVVLALVAAGLGVVLHTRSGTVVERVQPQEQIDGAGAADASTGGDDAAVQLDASRDTVFVHVSGAVTSPGLYELSSGSRVADAVREAGGVTPEADLDAVNLAAELVDGTKLDVPRTGEDTQTGTESYEGYDDTGSQMYTASLTQQGTGEADRVNLNSADAGQLETLPGIGPATASAIVEERERGGPYASVEDLTRVSGIGEKKLERIAELVCV